MLNILDLLTFVIDPSLIKKLHYFFGRIIASTKEIYYCIINFSI